MAQSRLLPITRTWQKPPGMPVGIIPSRRPRGLQFCWPFADPSFSEFIVGLSPTTRTTPLLSLCPYGAGLGFSATSSVLTYSFASALASTAPFSFEILVYVKATIPSGADIAAIQGGAAGHAQATLAYFYSLAGGGIQAFGDNIGTTAQGQAFTAGNLYSVVSTWDGSATLSIYVNAGTPGTTSQTANTATNPTKANFGTNGTAAAPNVIILLANWAPRVIWSPSEIYERFIDPYGFLIFPGDVSRTRLVGQSAPVAVPVFGWQFDAPTPQLRRSFLAPREDGAEAAWLFTATPTPGLLGWQFDPLRPQRNATLPARGDEPVLSPPVAAPTIFLSWDDQQRPQFRRPYLVRIDDQPSWPFTAATPSPLGWQAEQLRAQLLRRLVRPFDETVLPPMPAPTPGPLGWHVEILPVPRSRRGLLWLDEIPLLPVGILPGVAWDEFLAARQPIRRARMFADDVVLFPPPAAAAAMPWGWEADQRPPPSAIRRYLLRLGQEEFIVVVVPPALTFERVHGMTHYDAPSSPGQDTRKPGLI